MRLYRRTRRAGDKVLESEHVYLDFKDHAGAPRTLKLFTDHSTSAAFAAKLDRLIAARMAHEPLAGDLCLWVERMPAELRGKLAEWGILDAARAAAGKPLTDHVADFEAMLSARGATAGHAAQTAERVRQIGKGCGFERWSDIDAARVLSWLAGRRQGPKNCLSAATSNAYLAAFKCFCRWMIAERRASENPVGHLKPMNARPDRQKERRALTADECRRLIAATEQGAPVLGMPGHDRAMLYRLALSTGLRWSELRSLAARSFDLRADPATVTVEAGYSKHRRADTLPLRADVVAALESYLVGRPAGAPALPMPASDKGAKMIRADLFAAWKLWLREARADRAELRKRIRSDFLKATDSAGRVVDFHALRHSFISALADGGVHPKMAQSLARHSTIALTMDRYTHLTVLSQSDALDALPDLSAAAKHEAVSRTGTDDLPLTGNLTEVRGRLGTNLDAFGQGRKSAAEGPAEKKPQEPLVVSSDSCAFRRWWAPRDSNPRPAD